MMSACVVRFLLLALLGASTPLVVQSELSKENGVLVLDSTSLKMVLREEGLVMIEFYAPWCAHCKKLEPEYAKAAKDLEQDGLVLGKVDCDAHESLCGEDRWDIEGIPAIKVARGETVHDYVGPRDAAPIAEFMRKVAAFDPDDYDEDDEEGDLMEEDGIIILASHNMEMASDRFMLMMVLFYIPGKGEDEDLMQEYIEASNQLYEYYIPLAKVDCFLHKDLCQEERWKGVASTADGLPAIVILRDGEVFEYGERPRKAYNLVKFAKDLAGIDQDYDDDDTEDADSAKDNEDDEDDDEKAEVDESNVMVLDSSNMTTALEHNDALMIKFFAPWCGNCQRLAPKYAKAATELAVDGIRLAKVNCDENELLCTQDPWKVEAYPTLFLHRMGKATEYEDETEKNAIVEFMREVTQPRPKVLKDMDEFLNFITNVKESVMVVGFFAEEGGTAHQKFQAIANEDISVPFGVSFDPEVRAKNKHDSVDVVGVFRDFDEARVLMSVRSFTTQANIQSFIRSTSRRLVLKMGSPETFKILRDRPVTMFFITEDEETPSESTLNLLAIGNRLSKAAAHPMVYVHATLDGDGDGVFGFIVGEKNRKGNVPAIGITTPPGADGKQLKYLYKGEHTFEALHEFQQQYYARGLEPHFKSEPLLETDDQGVVKVVRGDSFKTMVMENDDNVLVDFYAPWCPHCKRLDPVLSDLAAKLEGREKMVIAKMDATGNDVMHPEVKTTKFPTILLFRANAKYSPEQYLGQHDVESMEAFLNEKTNHPLPTPMAVDPRVEL